MTKEETLADLRKTFGTVKSVLYAAELAQVMGLTTKAIYGLKDREGMPVPILPGTGRPCVSIHAVVDWLHGENPQAEKPAPAPEGAVQYPPVPMPKRRREKMSSYISTLRRQIDFLNELHSEIERLDMAEDLHIDAEMRAIEDAKK